MNVLIAIPHFVRKHTPPDSRHGATASAPRVRGRLLRTTVLTLHQTFGSRQALMQLGHRRTDAANLAIRLNLKVVVCVTGDEHELAAADLPGDLAEIKQVACRPVELGFQCHRALGERAEWADWFGYLEDDLLLRDPLTLLKLDWFQRLAGPLSVLQPNRFEQSAGPLAHKAYVDGCLTTNAADRFAAPGGANAPIADALIADALIADAPIADAPIADGAPEIIGDAMGRGWRFVRPSNPHSGCFFLNAAQMRHWASRRDFAQPAADFVGPLESAATWHLIRHFCVYKAARENAAFLEIEHQSQQFICQLRRRDP